LHYSLNIVCTIIDEECGAEYTAEFIGLLPNRTEYSVGRTIRHISSAHLSANRTKLDKLAVSVALFLPPVFQVDQTVSKWQSTHGMQT